MQYVFEHPLYRYYICSLQTTTNANVYSNDLGYMNRDADNPNIFRSWNWVVTMNCAIMRNGSIVLDLQPIHNTTGEEIDSTATPPTIQQAFYR